MDLTRLRPADWLCALASVALLVLLAMDWFRPDFAAQAQGLRSNNILGLLITGGVSTTGFGALGWLCVAFLVVAALGGLLLAVLTAAKRAPTAWPVANQVVLTAFALLTTLILLVVLLFQPGLGLGLPNDGVVLRWPAYAGLLATALIFVGAWRSMADERTTSRHAASTPPPARPAPPATAA